MTVAETCVQARYAGRNVPAVIIAAMESVNPNECTGALGLLAKLLIPEHNHNELFAQQYIEVRAPRGCSACTRCRVSRRLLSASGAVCGHQVWLLSCGRNQLGQA